MDRLDYTKGIEERLLAVERLLERHPRFQGRFWFAQVAAPSRTTIEAYRALTERVEALAARINERFGRDGWRPIILARRHHEPPAIFRLYRAADLCYVSSLHDGMNLVAKEFVAARDDLRGVLVLSRFTGAARELTEALIVNPYDIDAAAGALAAALDMPPAEQEERMRAMRALVAELNVYRWAGKMLLDATRARRRERLATRLGSAARERRRERRSSPRRGARCSAALARPGTLVVLDFDGTLAPIVEDRHAAGLGARTRRALLALARGGPVAVLSGRAAADVRARLRGVPLGWVIGSHGAEWPGEAGAPALAPPGGGLARRSGRGAGGPAGRGGRGEAALAGGPLPPQPPPRAAARRIAAAAARLPGRGWCPASGW